MDLLLDLEKCLVDCLFGACGRMDDGHEEEIRSAIRDRIVAAPLMLVISHHGAQGACQGKRGPLT